VSVDEILRLIAAPLPSNAGSIFQRDAKQCVRLRLAAHRDLKANKIGVRTDG
jgi:hypothetical protein